ncbi:unnamed protein product [Cylicocyclus nassatus]|uniref:NADP-dependent oxidoreductase domain-containing protein n=1 Tax=Cylicocyclus nassatus TaxID=53992 RepID=A0AA36GJN5_CYLNA|nr:unnamed protein product [Cylicocyclus nassatus]
MVKLQKAEHVFLNFISSCSFPNKAFVYGNEAVIGKVLHEYFTNGKMKREDVFITSKLPLTAHAPADVEKVLKMQLAALQLDYLYLYLVHSPVPFEKQDDTFAPAFVDGLQVPVTIDHVETWHALEKLYDAGKFKALGLSNFNTKQVQNVYDHARIKPSNLQVECHLYWPQTELFQLCKKLNMSLTAYAPLGSRGRMAFNEKMIWGEGDPLTDPLVKEVAGKHNKTTAQVLLRHLIQRGIVVIPKSVKPERVKENFDVFDFTLSAQEMEKLGNIKKKTRLFLFDLKSPQHSVSFSNTSVANVFGNFGRERITNSQETIPR